MLPARGRGRGRGRGRDNREVPVPGRQEFFQSPEEEELSKETAPPSSVRSRAQQPSFHLSRDDSGKPLSELHSHSGESSKSQDEQNKKSVVDPEEIIRFQLKRKLAITPTRPGEGSLGKRIKLVSNCFPLTVPSGNIYHYDVCITRKRRNLESAALFPVQADKKYRCLNTKKNREIIKLMLDTNPIFHNSFGAYDGQKNLYTRSPILADFPVKCEIILPDEDGNLQDPEGLRQDAFEVEIKPVIKKETGTCMISLDTLHALFENKTTSVSQEAVMALETILRHGPSLRFTPIGRSFFYPPNPQDLHPLGGGLEIWFGYHQSIRLGQWGPMVNLDLTATTFYQKGPVLSYIAEFMKTTVTELRRRPHLPNIDIRKISNKIKNRRVEVIHLRNYRRKYRIFKLVKENAHHLEFELKENGRVVRKTVAAYFRERYNRVLDFPNLPCLQVYPENKKTYLPIEVCEFLEGQHCKTKLESKQTSEMIKFTARAPNERFSEIRGITNRVNFNNDQFVRHFDLEVSREPLHLQGRVLDSPNIRYRDGRIVKPKDGSWNMRETRFLRGAIVKSWALLSLTDLDSPSLNKFASELVKVGRRTGITINDPKSININTPECDLKSLFLDMKTKYGTDLVVIVIPESDKYVYGRIKLAAETVVGVATQCIKKNNVINPRKCTVQLLTNLCQKINSKIGGENNSLVPDETPDIFKKPVIIIGADVNHPGLSHDVKPSLAACVGSLDRKLSRYSVSIRAQNNIDEKKQTIEIIRDLKTMVVDLLKAFYRHTRGMKPEKIIFYRDGVSEGQFEKVREHEVRSIREACRLLGEDYKPDITFIIVQKRHHVRFMPEDPRDGVGSMNNIPAGTTVDTVVTHPVNFDFYLCSHFGLKGTSRPPHYTVLEDDSDFSADDIQKLSYQLCHTYARCTRSISIPVPVAYADLAAFRARQHLEAGLEVSTSSSDSSASDVQPASYSVEDAIKVINGLQNEMYFV